ncbi:hypothetical protein [Occallatibacter riparius]|uniref:Lipocalin-like domain-containing protein n=1 Tax=Occallatibacter riparius TaxID=1002689 RepID=A0A9J7BPH7_9BACT|nr:hypothetical protein [Occallatibacter riparius]UWZ83037.1 hypothetical protein MOP44_21000 [Occallatibacter riparius]
MQRFLRLAIATLAITSAAAAFAADNSLGSWKLNVAKSKYSPGPLPVKSLSSTREADGEGVKVTTTGERADGSAINATYTAKFDGTPASVSGQGAPYDTISLKQVNANTFSYESKNSTNKYHVSGRLVISADGKTMTMNAKGTDAAGKPISITLVYDKQ